MRQCAIEFIIIAESEKNPVRREMLNQRTEHEREQWMRRIEIQRSYEKHIVDSKKLMLKFLDKEDHERFLEWVAKN